MGQDSPQRKTQRKKAIESITTMTKKNLQMVSLKHRATSWKHQEKVGAENRDYWTRYEQSFYRDQSERPFQRHRMIMVLMASVAMRVKT